MNTYQAMVIGSADREVVKVLYIYQDRQMLWDIPVWGSGSLGYYPARIGVIYNAYGTVPSAQEYGSSGLSTSVSQSVLLELLVSYHVRASSPDNISDFNRATAVRLLGKRLSRRSRCPISTLLLVLQWMPTQAALTLQSSSPT